MPVAIATVESLVVASLNLADAYQSASDDPRAFTNQIRDSALAADAQCVLAGLNNPTWGHRKEFFSTVSVAHGATIPTHVGPIESVIVDGKAATLCEKSKIESERADVLSLGNFTPHYWIEGDTLYHNGSGNAQVTICTFTMGLVCQSPDELLGAVTRGTRAMVENPEGEDPQSAGLYLNAFQADLASIGRGEIPPPFVQLGQAA